MSLILGIGAITAMLGVLLSRIVGISRVMLAMARRSDLPPALGHVSAKQAAPDRGILLTGLIIALLAIFGTLSWVVTMATFTRATEAPRLAPPLSGSIVTGSTDAPSSQ